MYKVIMGVALVGAVSLLAGCGSSGGGSTTASETTAAPLTKAQFVKRAEEICSSFGEEWEAALISAGKEASGSTEEAEADVKQVIAQKVAPLMQKEAEELEALAAPAGDEAKVSRMLANFSRASHAASEGDLAKIATSGFATFGREAAAYGLGSCPS